ncbi:MAG: pentapeptide repeat-containing protein [Solirubrobacterales bacterium]
MNINTLKADCKNCFGFCCIALYFSKSEGFPVNKDSGKPCPNLNTDFKCKVHSKLSKLGLKGCIAYDCFGAGQQTAWITYGGKDWRKYPETADEMFKVFLIMHKLHEMLWYLSEAVLLESSPELLKIINETIEITNLKAESILKIDIDSHREKVNILLLKTSKLIQNRYKTKKSALKYKRLFGGAYDMVGKDLRKVDLAGENLSGAYMIAANLSGVDLSGTDLLGADLRDADLSDANLTNSIYITQGQINSAKGNKGTKLPYYITVPRHFEK